MGIQLPQNIFFSRKNFFTVKNGKNVKDAEDAEKTLRIFSNVSKKYNSAVLSLFEVWFFANILKHNVLIK